MAISPRLFFAAVLLLSVWLTFSTAANAALTGQASDSQLPKPENAPVTGLTAGRSKSIAAGLLAVVSVVGGGMAKIRRRRTLAKIGLTTGLVAVLISLIHLSTSAGAALGSGSGKAGAFIALVLGLIGSSLSGLVLRQKAGS
ncbi:hypothetical protein C7T94_18260 [Pedobacter yulinensis]|uniref:Uncharacterized protein n=1 Tax=Pedobacter yulinensis TaxID=2126353 RepID=A0A2T3HHA9_9SPHI|nr:DUF6223 family protein [Pedobacter yulinensis]PST81812.1 hypothetical protein C7T94_18260 [Pedobacter yulinensis]